MTVKNKTKKERNTNKKDRKDTISAAVAVTSRQQLTASSLVPLPESHFPQIKYHNAALSYGGRSSPNCSSPSLSVSCPLIQKSAILPAKRLVKKLQYSNGNNSDDESQLDITPERIEISVRELEEILSKKRGWKIYRVKSDGACLFRSVSHQIFGDEENHRTIRQNVMDYMVKNRAHFCDFISEDFDRYVSRKRQDSCFGNHIEIQAISELYNRPVEIYRDALEQPVNVLHNDYSDMPLRLSYHLDSHYNSVVDPGNPSVGHGLGMPKDIQPLLPEEQLLREAVAHSESLYTEALLLESQMKAAEQDDLSDALAQQAIQESVLSFLAEQNARRAAVEAEGCSFLSTAAVSSDVISMGSQHTGKETPTFTSDYVDEEDEILAKVLVQSRQDYNICLQQRQRDFPDSSQQSSSGGECSGI